MVMAGRHVLENNKFRFTPANIAADCGEFAMKICGTTKKDAMAYLCTHLGSGSSSTAYRWLQAAECFKHAPLARAALEVRHTAQYGEPPVSTDADLAFRVAARLRIVARTHAEQQARVCGPCRPRIGYRV